MIGILLIVAALATWAGAAVIALQAFSSVASWSMPTTESTQLTAGSWTIFEKVPAEQQNSLSMTEIAKARTVTVEQLQVVGPGGAVKLTCAYCSEAVAAVPLDLTLHNAIASFRADTTGEYRIVSTSGTAQLAIADPVRALTESMPSLTLLSLVGLVLVVAGISLLVRRGSPGSTGSSSRSMGNQSSGAPPPGWYPNPYLEGTTSQMWWDGKKWTSNWR